MSSLKVLHFRKIRNKKKTVLNSIESDIANVCFNLLDEDAEDDDFVDVCNNIYLQKRILH